MKDMYLKELIDVVVIVKLSITLLEMLNLVETCILNLRRKALLHLTAVNIGHKDSGSARVTDILLERA